jgi:C4-dicarboxylate-specific signal transduction histidine kinase
LRIGERTSAQSVSLVDRRSTSARTARWLAQYALAIAAVIIATGLTHLVDQWSIETPRTLFYATAIALTTWFAGAGPGALSIVLSAFLVDYFFIPPIHEVSFGNKSQLWFLIFIGIGVAAYLISLQRRRSEHKLAKAKDELEAHVKSRTVDLIETNKRLAQEINQHERTLHEVQDLQSEMVRMARVLTVGELTASIAHELNQPLMSVTANAEAALNWLQQGPPNIVRAQRSVSDVLIAANRASEILRHIRKLINHEPLHLEPLSLNDVVNSALSLARSTLRQNRIHVERRLTRPLNPIRGDRVQLEQMILNLLTNAIEALGGIRDRNRSITIKTDNLSDHSVVLTFEDNGCGVANPDIEQIFKPFYSTKQNGMGMGLSIVRSIAKWHDGTISMQSAADKGTEFRIVFPTSGLT